MSYLQLVKQDSREQWASERIKNAAWRGKQINIFVYLYMYEVYDTIRIHIQKQRYSLLLLSVLLRWFIIDVRCVFYARAFVSMCFCTECAVKKWRDARQQQVPQETHQPSDFRFISWRWWKTRNVTTTKLRRHTKPNPRLCMRDIRTQKKRKKRKKLVTNSDARQRPKMKSEKRDKI